ncbi:MAG: hypothetical protein ACLQGP_06150 [Isosphaeraceae bacterium]
MPDAAFPIEPSMAPRFRLEAWDALDDDGRRVLGEYLSERLRALGWGVPEPMTLTTAGPPGESRSVLQWREPASGLTFSMIPGGTFRPGFDDSQLTRVAELIRLDSGEEDDEDGSEGPAVDPSLGLKPPVDVAPFFLATELVRPSLPGLRAVAKLPEDAAKGKALYGYDFTGDAIEFPWNQVEPVLDHFRWSLPTSAEFEWALRGGVSSVFYWGDDFPEFMEDVDVGWRGAVGPDQARAKAAFDACLSAAFDPDRPREWPWCNRFGLAAMLPRNTWCAASTEPGDPAPLITRGGAAHFYPWQGGCFEWMMLLNAFEFRSPVTADPKDFLAIPATAAIRPMIRLGATA